MVGNRGGKALSPEVRHGARRAVSDLLKCLREAGEKLGFQPVEEGVAEPVFVSFAVKRLVSRKKFLPFLVCMRMSSFRPPILFSGMKGRND